MKAESKSETAMAQRSIGTEWCLLQVRGAVAWRVSYLWSVCTQLTCVVSTLFYYSYWRGLDTEEDDQPLLGDADILASDVAVQDARPLQCFPDASNLLQWRQHLPPCTNHVVWGIRSSQPHGRTVRARSETSLPLVLAHITYHKPRLLTRRATLSAVDVTAVPASHVLRRGCASHVTVSACKPCWCDVCHYGERCRR